MIVNLCCVIPRGELFDTGLPKTALTHALAWWWSVALLLPSGVDYCVYR
jgi:hypothetical protein